MTLKDEYYTEEEVLEFLQISLSALQRRRYIGKNHPPFIKIGKKFLYDKKGFAQWVKSQETKQAIA